MFKADSFGGRLEVGDEGRIRGSWIDEGDTRRGGKTGEIEHAHTPGEGTPAERVRLT